MKRLAALSLLLCLAGCMGNDGLGTMTAAQNNVVNLSRLKNGMTETEVLSIMHDPYSRQNIVLGADSYDVLFYVTHPSVLGQISMVKRNLTPLTFKNGTLVGWGFVYYNHLQKEKEKILHPKPKAPAQKEKKSSEELEKILEQPSKSNAPLAPETQKILSPPKQQNTPPQQSPNAPAAPSKPAPKQQNTPPQQSPNAPATPSKPAPNTHPANEAPNWGPISPQTSPPPQPSNNPPSNAPAKKAVTMSSKPSKQEPPPKKDKDSKPEKEKKPLLNEEDNEMLEDESEQNFNQTSA
jgi:hypothetical protein